MPAAAAVVRTVAALFAAALVFGCQPKKPPALVRQPVDYTQELPAGQVALRKIDRAQWPRFSMADNSPAELRRAVQHSLTYLRAPSSRGFYDYLDVSHDRAVATCHAMLALIDQVERTGVRDEAAVNRLVAEQFEVYQSVGAPDPSGAGYTNEVLYTGYFTPIYSASLTRTSDYRYPLYKRPADLQIDEATGQVFGRKTADGSVVPHYTRSEIESATSPLGGQELVWLKDRLDAYVITVQGSARLRLADGRIYEVGYNGTNGYDYVSPGKQMLADGVITKDQLTLRGLREHFRAHPQAADKYLALNKRYVFFTERPGGPFGSLNVPVTPWATIATDKAVYPRGMPAFLTVPVPAGPGGGTRPYRGFMMDQDTGGAIRAAGRCDIYMGVGPGAEALAGQQHFPGQLYYLAVRPELVEQYLSATTAAAQ
ncbi:MAG TPA: MltA domain-containing protein [Tepidisphaeraceae bacterium]|nr:MltA domain-containing protein [Tepidisphaeraceae bacterium]